jgi:hypothetical protein
LRADILRAQADRLTTTGAAPLSFIEYLDQETGVLDEAELREDLQDISAGRRDEDPERNVTEARRLRQEGLDLIRLLIPLAAAVVVLTVANITDRRRLRSVLVGAACVVWVVVLGMWAAT